MSFGDVTGSNKWTPIAINVPGKYSSSQTQYNTYERGHFFILYLIVIYYFISFNALTHS